MLRQLPQLLRPISQPSSTYPLLRSISTTRPLSISLESPSYPSLYYHSLPTPPHPPNSYSLSFLPTPPPSLSFSPTTIGILSLNAVDRAQLKDGGEGAGIPELLPRNFEENKDFGMLLEEVLKEEMRGDLWLGTAAKVRMDGYIHIADHRNPADPNRVPDPSDIIASVLVENGELLPESYSPSGTHRIVTMDGMMKLPDTLMKKFVESLEKVRKIEVEIAEQETARGEEVPL
ncbi:hypothetical protein P7C70_g4235, partial [Phenoliferia sp. Uapishka_3]